MKLALDVWYEFWEEAGSRGLDTWYALEESSPGRNANHPLGAEQDESDSDAGGGGQALLVPELAQTSGRY